MKKLPKIAIEILSESGCPAEDFEQIAEAYGKTVYTNVKTVKDMYGLNRVVKERISAKKARELLGEKGFWSGLERSTFHWSTSRSYGENGDIFFSGDTKKIGDINFDSSKLYRQWKESAI